MSKKYKSFDDLTKYIKIKVTNEEGQLLAATLDEALTVLENNKYKVECTAFPIEKKNILNFQYLRCK